MALTAYDNSFSFRQNELATKGHQAPRGMSAEQYEKFKASPFMQRMLQQEERTDTLTTERDKQRKARDSSFAPTPEDFTAPKAFDYDRAVNYYRVLGIDEYASLDEVKKAYKKLSLVYHPDKSAGLPPEQQEEHAGIFIELKNAYQTLGDQATRRQYDRDRDNFVAGAEVNGYKKRADKVPFDAAEVLKKLQEMQKPPGKVIVVELPCKIEKFFYGGQKLFTKSRRVIRENYEFYDEKRFRIDLPRGAQERWECTMKGGDMNWDTQPDMMKFVLTTKPHPVLERAGSDLRLKQDVRLRPDAHLQQYLRFDVHTMGGRTLVCWGRNPFYSQPGAAKAQLDVSVLGEGIGSSGRLHFSARCDAERARRASGSVVVGVTATYTKLPFCCALPSEATVGDLHQSIREVLQWPEDVVVVAGVPASGSRIEPFGDPAAKLGPVRDVVLDPPSRLYSLPMSVTRARELLDAVIAFAGTAPFCRALRRCIEARGSPAHERLVCELWAEASWMAPLCGYPASHDGLRNAVQRALWVVRDEPDGPTMQRRFRSLGFCARRPPPPKVVRRRKLPVPALDTFLIRNGLAPASWGPSGERAPDPGSETDPDEPEPPQADAEGGEGEVEDCTPLASCVSPWLFEGRGHGHFAASGHPAMLRRARRRTSVAPTCQLELSPLFAAGVPLHTQPPCTLHFYSNLRQARSVAPGLLPPQPLFAVAISCPSGAKRAGRAAWFRLRHNLVPLVRQAAFLLVREAHRILPRPLSRAGAYPDEQYISEEGVSVSQWADDGSVADAAPEDAEEKLEVLRLARQRVREAERAAAARGGGGGGGMFDFDGLEDSDKIAEVAEEIRQERFLQRREKQAIREVWDLNARQQQKRSEYVQSVPRRAEVELAAPLCKQLATRSFKLGDCFLAQGYYSRELAALAEEDVEARAVALSNRSACWLRLRLYEAALEDAREAARLRPDWGRAWGRCGAALDGQGLGGGQEARAAWFEAAAHDPSIPEHVAGLAAAFAVDGGASAETSARERKEQGNEATRVREWGRAVAHYTVGLALLPRPQEGRKKDDELALLRAILHANRSSAFARLKLWQAALADGEAAVACSGAYAKAHLRLGVAQLGCRLYERAYASFANALRHDAKDHSARKGLESCLCTLPFWSSQAAARRRARFAVDAGRAPGSSRVFVLSEGRLDSSANEQWSNGIHSTKFLDDVLLITGNLADSYRALERAFTCLRPKFRRLFFVPGNHETWITRPEQGIFPDSLSKLLAIMELCDELDVDVFPAAIADGVYVVPLLSWYSATFDIADPFPDPAMQANKHCKWAMDQEQQLWRYMLRLNQDHLDKPYHGTVITFSHFAPRTSCPVLMQLGARKISGCAELDEQVRAVRSSCHAYGHTQCRFNEVLDGVKYVHRPLLVDVAMDGTVSKDPLLCIFDGTSLCFDMVET